jgi:hypothetical protein
VSTSASERERVLAPVELPERGMALQRSVLVRGQPINLRMVPFAGRWMASAQLTEGQSVGVDSSPYLAALQALEPLNVPMVELLSQLGPFPRA